MNKNLWLLILSQIFAFTAAPVTVFLSGIIGSKFSPIKLLEIEIDLNQSNLKESYNFYQM